MTRFEQICQQVGEECDKLFGRRVNLTTEHVQVFFPEFKPATISNRVSDGSIPRAGNSGRKPRFTFEEIAKYAIKIGRYRAT